MNKEDLDYDIDINDEDVDCCIKIKDGGDSSCDGNDHNETNNSNKKN